MEIELEYVACDVCGANKNKNIFQGRDYIFGRKELYSIVRCNGCGLIYLNPRPTADSIKRLYEENYTPSGRPYILPKTETSRLRILLKKIWHLYIKGYNDDLIKRMQGKILDIGCRSGDFLLSVKNKCEAYGVEVNPVDAKYCNEAGLNVFCGILEDADFEDDFFDAIVLSHVMEHLPSPKKTLGEIYRILKPGGKVYILCPNPESYGKRIFGRYWYGWHIPFHFYSFTVKTIKNLTDEVGFKIIKISTVSTPHNFATSLKSFIWGRYVGNKSKERGKYFNSLFFKAFICFFLRIFDFVLKEKGDCIEAEFFKRNNLA
jgi:SAM-dependent methyltransferase